MHMLTGWFIRNPVAADLAMVLILFLGVQTILSIRIEGFPRIPPENVIITIAYPDATADQVDELVTQKVEQALEGLAGVRAITARSVNGLATIAVRRAAGEKLQAVLDRVRIRIDGITDLPTAARRPVIEASGYDFPALYVNLHGDADPATLQSLAERLKQELLSEPELSRLKIWGLIPREMRIEVDPEQLRQYGLIVEDVAQAIRQNSLNFQAGQLRTDGGTIFLRADTRARYAPDFARIPVVDRANGPAVPLGDIARIRDGFLDGDFLFRLNGQPTVGMEVLVGQKENLLTISAIVRQVVDDFRPLLPPAVSATVWGDSAGYISDRLDLLADNGIQGLILVTLLLSIFLNVRLAFWVAMGIPISVMGAIAVAGSRWVDYSLNDVTTFGLIIALGILVDDAVVVGESVFEERRKTADPVTGTERGVNRVSVATIFGVLTTIAAFYPMLLIDNALGKVLAGFSGIVILTLIFSLFESKFILPAHLAAVRLDRPARHLLTFEHPARSCPLGGVAVGPLGQIGELSFILATIAIAGGVAPQELLPALVTVATITAFTTPFLLGRAEGLVTTLDHLLPDRANELLGARKGTYRHVHPNDHVNMSQSSNDTFPTAMRLMKDFSAQLKEGIDRPVFDPEKFADLDIDKTAWNKHNRG